VNINVNTSAAASAIYPPLSSDHTPYVNSFLMVAAVPMPMPTRRSLMQPGVFLSSFLSSNYLFVAITLLGIPYPDLLSSAASFIIVHNNIY